MLGVASALSLTCAESFRVMKTPKVTPVTAVDQTIPEVPKIEIVYKRIDWVIEYLRNPRKNDPVVDRMCGSIREFGFAVPMLCRSTGEIVDGHLRYKAAKKLGIKEVPVVLCDHWTENQVRAFRLMVNQSVAWAEWLQAGKGIWLDLAFEPCLAEPCAIA